MSNNVRLVAFIMGEAPLGESASFFTGMKKFAGFGDPPDETGELEGQFSAPFHMVVQAIVECAKQRFRVSTAYRVYSESVRGLAHDALSKHFADHADDEMEAAKALMRRANSLAGGIYLGDIESPPPNTQPEQIIRILIRA